MTAANYVKLVKLLGATNRYLLTPGVISNSEWVAYPDLSWVCESRL